MEKKTVDKDKVRDILKSILLDFMGVEIQKDGSEIYYTMELDDILTPLTGSVASMIEYPEGKETKWKLNEDNDPIKFKKLSVMKELAKSESLDEETQEIVNSNFWSWISE